MSGDANDGAPVFDMFFPAIDTSAGMVGYDEHEGDYFGLNMYETDAAQRNAKKRLFRLTKEQLCDLAGTAFRIARSYWGLLYRFDCLKAEIDIIRGQNEGLLNIVKAIDAAWKRWDQETEGGKWDSWKKSEMLDRMLQEIPDRAWVE